MLFEEEKEEILTAMELSIWIGKISSPSPVDCDWVLKPMECVMINNDECFTVRCLKMKFFEINLYVKMNNFWMKYRRNIQDRKISGDTSHGILCPRYIDFLKIGLIKLYIYQSFDRKCDNRQCRISLWTWVFVENCLSCTPICLILHYPVMLKSNECVSFLCVLFTLKLKPLSNDFITQKMKEHLVSDPYQSKTFISPSQ
jgi:hypothetical protein